MSSENNQSLPTGDLGTNPWEDALKSLLGEEIALQSKNKLVPWSTIIKTSLENEMSQEEIKHLVLDQLLYL